MQLENLLNYDLQVSNRHQCVVTAHLLEDDPRKYLLSIPHRITIGLKKIWEHTHGAQSPNHVVQDVYIAFEARSIVYKANGKMVPGLTNRNGHQCNTDGSEQWGGAQIKSYDVLEDSWLEPGAKTVLEDRKTFTKSRYLEHE